MKNCKNKDCAQVNPQPLENFFKDKGLKDGHSNTCKICKNAKTIAWREKNPKQYNKLAKQWRDRNPEKQHATDIKRLYGLSIERYNEMLTKQACGCKICGKQHDPSLKRGRLYVDHCHITGEIRGLLCGGCNSAIGYFKDDVSLLEKAIAYINNSKKSP